MEFEIRKAQFSDAVLLAPRLRESDVNEIRAASGMDPLAALVESVKVSDEDMCWCATLEGRPEVLFGASPFAEDIGGIWLLGSARIYDAPFSFLRHCRDYLKVMHERYLYLTNFVDIRHNAANKWIAKLGFKPAVCIPDFGFERRPFTQYLSKRSS